MPAIVPMLWFDDQAEEAATFYVSLFPNSEVTAVNRTGDGSVLTVDFVLDGRAFTGLDGGPMFRFTEAVSFVVPCVDQAEVDHYWYGLLEGGEESQCGWLEDRFGVSWQVVPEALGELLGDPDPERAGRAMAAMLSMRKFDVAALRAAADGA